MFRFSHKNEKKIATKKHFVWDFDGSFSNTERIHFCAYRDAFADYGHTLEEGGYYESFTHLGQGALREIEKKRLNLEVQKIMERKKEHFWRRINEDPIPDFTGGRELLEILQSMGSVAIASNSYQQEIEIVLRRTNLINVPKLIVGKDDSLRSKPAPDIFLRAMQLLKAPPADLLIFEDSDRGLAAAAAAGIDAILVSTEFNSNLQFQSPYLERATHEELKSAFTHLIAMGN